MIRAEEKLRDMGFKVDCQHYRRYFRVNTKGQVQEFFSPNRLSAPMSTHGGYTKVTIRRGKEVYSGTARCMEEDRFIRQEGYDRAFERAVRELCWSYIDNASQGNLSSM